LEWFPTDLYHPAAWRRVPAMSGWTTAGCRRLPPDRSRFAPRLPRDPLSQGQSPAAPGPLLCARRVTTLSLPGSGLQAVAPSRPSPWLVRPASSPEALGW